MLGDANQSSEGTRYLCVYRDGIEDGVVSYNDGKVIIPSNYLNKMDFSKYPTTAYIAYDYKSGWVGGNFWFGPRFVSSEYGGYANILGGNLVCDGEWHTFYIPISYLPKGFDTLELLFQGGSYGNMYFDNFRVVGEVLQGTGSQFIATGYSI